MRALRALLCILILLVAACDPRERTCATEPSPARDAVPVLTSPASTDAPDVDLHYHAGAAWVDQCLAGWSHTGGYRVVDLHMLGGVGRRALLLVPSARGQPSRIAFKVAVPSATRPRFQTWLAIEPWALARTDGVDFAIAVAPAGEDPATTPLVFTRLTPQQAARWHPVTLDLGAHAGTSIWLILASRELDDPDSDWLLWGDPHITVPATAPARIDLTTRASAEQVARAVPWSEVTIFKSYSFFSDDVMRWLEPTWLARTFPWLTGLRVFSALGGNWGPTLAARVAAGEGGGHANEARQFAFFEDGATAEAGRFRWRTFDRLNDRLAATGLELRLNLAGAPETFTGGRAFYDTYQTNEMPVVDEPGWRRYVDTLFAHLAAQPWFARARFSFFNEANCRWVETGQPVRQLGFQGTAEEYARQYLWTWQAMRPHLLPGQTYLGPWVVEPDPASPALDNLAEHLETIQRVFAAADEPLPDWSGFAFNLYESPRLALDHFAEYKIAYVRDLLRAMFPDRTLPIRLDEFGIHPLVTERFEAASTQRLHATRWAMSWHAEMLALLAAECVERAASWLSSYLAPQDRPISIWASHFFLSVAAHGADYVVEGEEIVALPARAGPLPETMQIRLASRQANRIGSLWTTTPDGADTRLVVWRHPRALAEDARLADEAPERVEITLPPGHPRVRVVITAFADHPMPTGGTSRRLTVRGLGAVPPLTQTEIEATAPVSLTLRAGDLFLVEMTAAAVP